MSRDAGPVATRFTIAHELGHSICYAKGSADPATPRTVIQQVTQDAAGARRKAQMSSAQNRSCPS